MTAAEAGVLAGALILAGAIAMTDTPDERAAKAPVCVLDTSAVYAAREEWAEWPVCVDDDMDGACWVDGPGAGGYYTPYCADELGAP